MFEEDWACVLHINPEQSECPLDFTISKSEPSWGQYSVAAEECGQIREDGVDPSPL